MQTIKDDDFLKFIGNQESQFIGMASDWKDEVLQRLNGEGASKADLVDKGF